MSTVSQIRRFTKAYTSYLNIENDDDLRKENLKIIDYHMIERILKELSRIDGTVSETISELVANWFKKFHFQVYPNGIGWSIAV